MQADWRAMMRAAVAAGVRPADFWDLSLKEWGMLCGGGRDAAPMSRTALETMMRDWPDETDVEVGDERPGIC